MENMLIGDDSCSSASAGGEIKKVDAFSDENSEDSESDDCIVETDTKIKSTGFFEKLKIRTMMRGKG